MKSIRVFGAEWCPACKQQKGWMESQNINFQYHDADEVEFTHELASLDVRSLPFTIVKSRTNVVYIFGFDPNKLMEAIHK